VHFLRTFLIATAVPILVATFLYVRLWQVMDLGVAEGLLSRPFDRWFGGGLIEAAFAGDNAAKIMLLIVAAAAVMAASLIAFVLSTLIALAVGKNRVAMVAVFPLYSLVSLLLATAFVIADVALLVGVVWAHAFGDAPLFSLSSPSIWSAIILVVGVLTVLGLVTALFRMFHTSPIEVLAIKAHDTDHPKVIAFIEDVARTVGAKPPKHVVLGLSLNFFATHAPVRSLDEPRLRGETLHLSLPSLRLLSTAELRAIIGHELGHFSGNDTRYSMGFAPAFRGLEEAVHASRKPILRLPNLLGWLASMRLEHVAYLFSRNVAAASRDREFAADEKGASAASAVDLASALVKMFIFSYVWEAQAQWNISRLFKGRVMRNLSMSFAERIRYDVSPTMMAELVQDSLLYQQAHPTDFHPPTKDRIRAMQVPQRAVSDPKAISARLVPVPPVGDALDDMRSAEEQLTRFAQRAWIARGARPKDDSNDHLNAINNIFANLLAHMVLADHKSDDREIAVVEEEAAALVPEFDYDRFRECCRDESALAPLDSLLEFASEILTDSGKEELVRLLEHIAQADGTQVSEESAIIAQAREAFGVTA
jgi:Zn-dependent protease with chaperone function